MPKPWKPTKEQLLAATEKTVRDVIAPDLRVLFCGINPGLYTAAVDHHFARPGNRFWPALYAAGFTDRLLSPFDERELLKSGYGITNVVARTSATADLLTEEEIVAGGERLRAKVLRYHPKVLAILGLGVLVARADLIGRTLGAGEHETTLPAGASLSLALPDGSGAPGSRYQCAHEVVIGRQALAEALARAARRWRSR